MGMLELDWRDRSKDRPLQGNEDSLSKFYD